MRTLFITFCCSTVKKKLTNVIVVFKTKIMHMITLGTFLNAKYILTEDLVQSDYH